MQERKVAAYSFDSPRVDVLVFQDMWTDRVAQVMEVLGKYQAEGHVGHEGGELPIGQWVDQEIEAAVLRAKQQVIGLLGELSSESLDEAIRRMLDEGEAGG